MLLRECETIQGYRLVTDEGDRASFERDGQLFSIRLGQPLPLAPSEATRDEAGMPPEPEAEAPRPGGPPPDPSRGRDRAGERWGGAEDERGDRS